MKLVILALVVGIAIGYGYGFKDAKIHKKSVVERTLDRVGGKNRGAYNNDIDKQSGAAER